MDEVTSVQGFQFESSRQVGKYSRGTGTSIQSPISKYVSGAGNYTQAAVAECLCCMLIVNVSNSVHMKQRFPTNANFS